VDLERYLAANTAFVELIRQAYVHLCLRSQVLLFRQPLHAFIGTSSLSELGTDNWISVPVKNSSINSLMLALLRARGPKRVSQLQVEIREFRTAVVPSSV
jgi:hypothetical protein